MPASIRPVGLGQAVDEARAGGRGGRRRRPRARRAGRRRGPRWTGRGGRGWRSGRSPCRARRPRRRPPPGSARTPTRARSLAACSGAAKRRSRMPVRLTIHSSLVSTPPGDLGVGHDPLGRVGAERREPRAARAAVAGRDHAGAPAAAASTRANLQGRLAGELAADRRRALALAEGAAPAGEAGLEDQLVARAARRGGSGRARCRRRARACPPSRGSASAASAPVWARASTMITPGRIGLPGKWPGEERRLRVDAPARPRRLPRRQREDLVHEEEGRAVREEVRRVREAIGHDRPDRSPSAGHGAAAGALRYPREGGDTHPARPAVRPRHGPRRGRAPRRRGPAGAQGAEPAPGAGHRAGRIDRPGRPRSSWSGRSTRPRTPGRRRS